MKVSGKCPKCDSTDIKENTAGGLGNMMAGRYYRCRSCGFVEIWQTNSDVNAVYGIYIVILLIALGFGAYLYVTG
tara:strand:- start:40 stop:264 length:225 start_codon:yes stop_codon:yes gene_type:complete